MDQRVSLITLAVADLDKSRAFYQELGWLEVESPDGIVAFDLLSQSLALYPISNLAEDMGIPAGDLGHGAMTLSYNGRNRADVDAVMAAAAKAGAAIVKEPQEVFWGGYGGYFRDLDGHIWEVTFNPFAPLRRDGAFCWGGH